jgi:phosphoribosyl 1,2-cyclic phosphodiesterase
VGGTVIVRARAGRDELALRSIALPHDADPTLAFRLEHGGRRAAICTDMGSPERGVAQALADVELLMLEFNHDPDMLAQGPYTPALKRRVGGPRGHLSNAQAAEVLRWSAQPTNGAGAPNGSPGTNGAALHTLVLAHLSRTNNRPLLALASAREVLAELGLAHVRVLVAEQDHPGPSLEV